MSNVTLPLLNVTIILINIGCEAILHTGRLDNSKVYRSKLPYVRFQIQIKSAKYGIQTLKP